MSDELKSTQMLVQVQGMQIAQLAQFIEMNVAVREAHETLIQCMIPLVRDHPEFKRALNDSYQQRLGHHLKQDVSNKFIQDYADSVNALLPKDLRFKADPTGIPTPKK